METHLRVYEKFFHTSLVAHERTALSMSSAIPWAAVPDQFKRIQVGWAQTFISRCFPTAMLPAASVACCHIFSIGMDWIFSNFKPKRNLPPPPPQSFVRDWSQEGKGNWHRNQENVSPSQDHNNGWAGVGATERTGTEGTWYRRGKRYSRIIDKYTRLLLSPESFGGCFIVCLRQGTRIPGFHRTWFVV